MCRKSLTDPTTQLIQLEHDDTFETFGFHRDDLDEVLEALIDFRAALKAGEVASES
jgi:hypothetical protein